MGARNGSVEIPPEVEGALPPCKKGTSGPDPKSEASLHAVEKAPSINFESESTTGPSEDENCQSPSFALPRKRNSIMIPQHSSLPEALLTTNFSACRFRKSCFFDATIRCGVRGMAPYAHTLLPIGYTTPLEEYHHLREHVAIWDVACERQVEIKGPDALKLAEMMTPRALGSMKVGECRYAMIVDQQGMVLNDPICLRVAEDKYWFSIADSDVLFFAKGLAAGKGLDVQLQEAPVSPLAIQGPKSKSLVRDLFGEWVDELKFYNFRPADLDDIPLLVARSGWSPELGYELYLLDESRGDELWEKVMSAGQKYNIKPGVPNHPRRIEGGLLTWGTDVTDQHSVLEMPVPPKWVGPDKSADFVGKEALKRQIEEGGPKRKIVGIELDTNGDGAPGDLPPLFRPWRVLGTGDSSEAVVGSATSASYSPGLNANVAICTLSKDVIEPGTQVMLEGPNGERWPAQVRKLPFMQRAG